MTENTETRPLNAKRLAFCREYIKDSNGTQAAIRAGYSEKTANEQAAQLLAILSVQQHIGQLLAELGAKVGWNAERSLMELLATRQRAAILNQPSAEVSALVAANRLFALDKDNNAGGGDKPNELTPDELEVLRADAKRLTALKLRTG